MKTGTVIGIAVGVALVLGLVCLGCLGLFGGLAWFGISAFKDLSQSTTAFVTQVQSGDLPGAYQAAAASLRQARTQEQFAADMKAVGLVGSSNPAFFNFQVNNGQASVAGSVTSAQGQPLNMTIHLVREGNTWRVTGVTGPGAAPPPPPAEALPPPGPEKP